MTTSGKILALCAVAFACFVLWQVFCGTDRG